MIKIPLAGAGSAHRKDLASCKHTWTPSTSEGSGTGQGPLVSAAWPHRSEAQPRAGVRGEGITKQSPAGDGRAGPPPFPGLPKGTAPCQPDKPVTPISRELPLGTRPERWWGAEKVICVRRRARGRCPALGPPRPRCPRLRSCRSAGAGAPESDPTSGSSPRPRNFAQGAERPEEERGGRRRGRAAGGRQVRGRREKGAARHGAGGGHRGRLCSSPCLLQPPLAPEWESLSPARPPLPSGSSAGPLRGGRRSMASA